MNPTPIARRLRREQTDEERELWRALRAGRFAGFKFRRQHPVRDYFLDFYCPAARLAVELDGFQHGLPEQIQHDQARADILAAEGIAELRFWNRQWHTNRDGVLLEIWHALEQRTGRARVMRKVQNHRFIPPDPKTLLSPSLSSIPNGGEGVAATPLPPSGHPLPLRAGEGRGEGDVMPSPPAEGREARARGGVPRPNPSPSPPAEGGEGRGEEGTVPPAAPSPSASVSSRVHPWFSSSNHA